MSLAEEHACFHSLCKVVSSLLICKRGTPCCFLPVKQGPVLAVEAKHPRLLWAMPNSWKQTELKCFSDSPEAKLLFPHPHPSSWL